MANDYVPWKQDYVSEFLSLRCAGDVLNIVAPLGSRANKEITESMAIVKRLRPILLKQPVSLRLVELCAGNALTSVLVCHLLPVLSAKAYDVKKRRRHWFRCDRFTYYQEDINGPKFGERLGNADIVIAVHPCRELAVEVCRLFVASRARYLLLMPCCKGSLPAEAHQTSEPLVNNKLTAYERWCLGMSSMLRSMGSFDAVCERDTKCISPCNIVIKAVRL